MERANSFLYLTERETVLAGADDLASCVDTMEEVMRLVDAGDYLMGGPSQNQHGLRLYFPAQSPFPGMPLHGPDRRFMALVGYLGGRFGVCGVKWYGSNTENRANGLPRSLHIIVLNDPASGLPVCILSGSKISAARTGAMAGLGGRLLAKAGPRSLGLVGAGVIGQASCQAILHACPSVQRVRIYNRTAARARGAAERLAGLFGVEAAAVESVRQAVAGSDIVVFAASGPDKPALHYHWLAPGALVVFSSDCVIDPECIARCTWAVDNWKMFEAYGAEPPAQGKHAAQRGDVPRLLMNEVRRGALSREDIRQLGPVASGRAPGRESDEEIVLLALDGMCVEDLAWAHTVYSAALGQGLGTWLPFF